MALVMTPTFCTSILRVCFTWRHLLFAIGISLAILVYLLTLRRIFALGPMTLSSVICVYFYSTYLYAAERLRSTVILVMLVGTVLLQPTLLAIFAFTYVYIEQHRGTMFLYGPVASAVIVFVYSLIVCTVSTVLSLAILTSFRSICLRRGQREMTAHLRERRL